MHGKCGHVAYYHLSSVRCNAFVGVLGASYISYLIVLLAAEVVLVMYDRPVALEGMMLGFSVSCIAALLGEVFLYVYRILLFSTMIAQHDAYYSFINEVPRTGFERVTRPPGQIFQTYYDRMAAVPSDTNPRIQALKALPSGALSSRNCSVSSMYHIINVSL
jgi:hypothetical protein